MFWFLVIYAMGVCIATESMTTSFDMPYNPYIALMWPMLLLVLLLDWMGIL
jgi:hypothetical protein